MKFRRRITPFRVFYYVCLFFAFWFCWSILRIPYYGIQLRDALTSQSTHVSLIQAMASVEEDVQRQKIGHQPVVSPAWEKIQEYLSVEFMQNRVEARPLFNFTLLPWRINPNRPRSPKINLLKSDVRWSLVIVVKSHSSHFSRRELARQTWASYEYIDTVRIETIFVVGDGKTKEEEIRLKKESAIYGDILQIQINETYRNVCYKTLAGMQFISQNFPPNWMYSSADDDMMPDMMQFLGNMNEIRESTFKERNEKGKYIGFWNDSSVAFEDALPIFCGFEYYRDAPPFRKSDNKWYMNETDYPLKTYPTYCSGAWYAMSVKMMKDFFTISRTLPFFWIDDLWITGFIRLLYLSTRNRICENCPELLGLWTVKPDYYTIAQTGNEEKLLAKWQEVFQKIAKAKDTIVDY